MIITEQKLGITCDKNIRKRCIFKKLSQISHEDILTELLLIKNKRTYFACGCIQEFANSSAAVLINKFVLLSQNQNKKKTCILSRNAV